MFLDVMGKAKALNIILEIDSNSPNIVNIVNNNNNNNMGVLINKKEGNLIEKNGKETNNLAKNPNKQEKANITNVDKEKKNHKNEQKTTKKPEILNNNNKLVPASPIPQKKPVFQQPSNVIIQSPQPQLFKKEKIKEMPKEKDPITPKSPYL